MSWENILKIASERENFDEVWNNEEDKKKFLVYLSGQESSNSLHGKWVYLFSADTRQEAYNDLKQRMHDGGNPHPWTVEGSLYEGHAVVYDDSNPFRSLMLMAPSYWYYIADGPDDLPPSEPETIRVDWTSRERLLDRMAGADYDETREERQTWDEEDST